MNCDVLNKNLNTPEFIAGVLSMALFALSMVFLPLAVEGDQVHYIKYFESLPGAGFLEAFSSYSNLLGTNEPGYFLISFALHSLLDKVILMSLLNAVLSYYLLLWLCREKVSIIVILLLCFNFYLLVLFFSAERLKVAFMFSIISVSFTGKYRYAALLMSIVSHVQMTVLLLAIMFEKASQPIGRLIKWGKLNYTLLGIAIGVAAICVISFFLRDHLLAKYMYYSEQQGGLSLTWKPVLFTAMTLYYARNKMAVAFFQHAILILAMLMVGEDRLVIFSYMVFMYYGLKVNKGINAGVLLTCGYFFIKGAVFLINLIVYGDGFVSLPF